MRTRKVFPKGFLSWNEWGSRMTKETDEGLRSVDLGPITIEAAQEKARLNGVRLLVNGRLYWKRRDDVESVA